MAEITKDIYVEDLVEDYPDAVPFLLKHNIICIQCGAPVWGTLEENLIQQGVKDVDGFMRELNEFMKNPRPEA